MPYTVSVDDNFDYMDEDDRYVLGTFAGEGEAVAAARALVDTFLAAHCKPGMRASELYALYTSFGEDPFISGHPFSAWTYAQERCQALCAGVA